METIAKRAPTLLGRWGFGGLICGTALISFAARSLVSANLTRANEERADGDRVFQLLVYHAVPGKVPALESRFRDASKLQAQHELNVVGYWVPDSTDPVWANTFIYLVAHSSRDEAKKNWEAFHSDPAFQEYVKSEEANKLIESVDSTYMRPTDVSPMK